MNRKELQRRLRDIRDPAPPLGLRDRLESGIPDFQEQPERRWGRGSWTMMKVAAVTATAAVMIAAAVWIGVGPGGTSVTFAAVLDPVLEATDGVRAVHVVLRMLTREGEDFSYVNLDGEPRTVEAWIEWPQKPGDTGRARVDKTDRIYVYDGTQSVFYHPLRGEAYKGSGPFGHELFWPAAWVRQIRNQPPADVEVLAHEEIGNRGRLLIREKGADIGPLDPSFLGDFDRETEVVWDLDSNLLTDLRRWVLIDGERRLFSEVVSIDYLDSVDDDVFSLQLPENVKWGGVREAPVAILELGPREVAQRFFDAALDGDREQLELFCPSPSMVDWLLDEKHRPTEILYIGEPFRAGDYPGVYVPYKVRFGTGWFSVKEYNLALKNNNDQHRWVYDGGI
jgi:hypothetical protein